jgi:hypothetical protein
MTDVAPELALLKGWHSEFVGQQKEDGKPAPHCERPLTPPQVGACRGMRDMAWEVETRKKKDRSNMLEVPVKGRIVNGMDEEDRLDGKRYV